MLLGFKRRFAGFVWDGTKTHTIRAERKIEPRVGQSCDCYVDPRQRTMALLGRWDCIRIQPLEIGRGWIRVDTARLKADELDRFAWADGFRPNGDYAAGSYDDMQAYWQELGRERFRGHLISWRFDLARRAPRPGVLG